MTLDRKSFKVLYRLIKESRITETEAYNMALSIFWMPSPMPYYADEQTVSVQPMPDAPQPVEVGGFLARAMNKEE